MHTFRSLEMCHKETALFYLI